MSFKLTVRADGTATSWNVDEWSALCALGALSASPETLPEFFAALRRYLPRHRWDQGGQNAATITAATTNTGNWCLIDCPSRSVIAGQSFPMPSRRASYSPEEHDKFDTFPGVWIEMPPDWILLTDHEEWAAVVAERSQQQSEQPRPDVRLVLWGQPMLEFIATQVLAEATKASAREDRYERIRAIHATWLMTARDDLLGETPRATLLGTKDHIEVDIQHRSHQWTTQGFAPPPLDVDSATYRFGGFGTVEIVLYFDLMRELLDEAWNVVVDRAVDLETLVAHLAKHRDAWFDLPPDDGSSGQTCRELIDMERRRMPITEDPAHIDCDCPICRAQAEGAFGTGPCFQIWDGHHLEMEDEFAFSMIESREEWEESQALWACYNSGPDLDQADEPHQQNEGSAQNETDSVWSSHAVDWDVVLAADTPPIVAKMAIGFQVAELVNELKKQGAGKEVTETLNEAFTAFRRAEDRVVLQSAVAAFSEKLEWLATKYPELVARSADLQSRLDEFLRASPESPVEQEAALNQPTSNDQEQQEAGGGLTTPVLSLVVFPAPGPDADEIEQAAARHVKQTSNRTLGGALGYLTLETDDFDRLSAGLLAGDNTGAATDVLKLLGPQTHNLIGNPTQFGYCWSVNEDALFGSLLLLQVIPLEIDSNE